MREEEGAASLHVEGVEVVGHHSGVLRDATAEHAHGCGRCMEETGGGRGRHDHKPRPTCQQEAHIYSVYNTDTSYNER